MLGAVASAVTWPIVESYLGAGPPRRGDAGRDRLVQRDVDAGDRDGAVADAGRQPGRPAGHAGAVGGGSGGGAAAATFALPIRPGAHEPRSRTPPWVASIARCCARCRGCLPMSYVLCAVMAPLLPHRLAGGQRRHRERRRRGAVDDRPLRDADRRCGAPASGTGAGGRWSLAAGALALGLAAMMLAPSLAVLAAGLVVFGVGMGADLLRGAVLLAGGGARRGRRGRHVRGADRRRLLRRAAARSHRAGGRGAGPRGHRDRRARLAGGRRLFRGRAGALPRRAPRARIRRPSPAARAGAQQRRDVANAEPARPDPSAGARVRSRKRARSLSSTSANRIAGQRDAGRAQLPQDQDALSFGQPPPRVVVEIGRCRPAFVDQPVGAACGENPGPAAARPRRPRRRAPRRSRARR